MVLHCMFIIPVSVKETILFLPKKVVCMIKRQTQSLTIGPIVNVCEV